MIEQWSVVKTGDSMNKGGQELPSANENLLLKMGELEHMSLVHIQIRVQNLQFYETVIIKELKNLGLEGSYLHNKDFYTKSWMLNAMKLLVLLDGLVAHRFYTSKNINF